MSARSPATASTAAAQAGAAGCTAVDPGVDVAEQVGVVEQQEVGVEDGRLGLADVAGGAGAHLLTRCAGRPRSTR